MSEIEKMQRYIDRTKTPFRSKCLYGLNSLEAFALMKKVNDRDTNLPAFDVICLAFEYGRAKGYRAAKAEVRR